MTRNEVLLSIALFGCLIGWIYFSKTYAKNSAFFLLIIPIGGFLREKIFEGDATYHNSLRKFKIYWRIFWIIVIILLYILLDRAIDKALV